MPGISYTVEAGLDLGTCDRRVSHIILLTTFSQSKSRLAVPE
jgi:hypothetical protein